MKASYRFSASGPLIMAAVMMTLSGCVVRDHEVVHDGSYSQGYKEGYYDREHNRYWHEQAWHDCTDHDEHCH